MAIFPSMLITHQGQTLYNKAQAGIPINFTKIKIGSGRLSDGQDQTILAGLIDYKFDVPIGSISQNTQLQIAVISGRITNENITTGTYICELGLFADDPDVGEILYAYTNAADQGDYYAPAERGPFTWAYQINAAVGNAANVTATLVSDSTFDYAIDVSSSFTTIVGTNQQEVNESIDKQITMSNLALEESTGYGVISGLTVSEQSTPDMTVNATTGTVHMLNGIRLTPASKPTLVITAADATNPRIDIVYVNPNNIIEYMAGTPAAIPIAPNTPTGAFLLYQINVPPGVTEITNSNIVDMRKIKNTTDNNADAIANLTEDFDTHKADYLYQLAGGTATAITLTGVVLEDGHPKTFIASADNNGVATTINGKHFYKPGTTTSPTLKMGKAYTFWYNLADDCFFIKASAEGNAVAGDVLAGKIFSNGDDTGLVGTATISSLGGKKYGTGTVTSLYDGENFAQANGSYYWGYRVTVTGLTFKPNYIILYSTDLTIPTVIYNSDILFGTDSPVLVEQHTGGTSIAVKNTWGATSIYNGGFILPAPVSNKTFNYIAVGI